MQNLSVGADFFRRLGGFDERFPSIGDEDRDLCLRARKAGAIIVLDSEIPVIHNDQHAGLDAICGRRERGPSKSCARRPRTRTFRHRRRWRSTAPYAAGILLDSSSENSPGPR
jgi:GT2 family glycosyltransferase